MTKDARYGTVADLKEAAVLAGLPCPTYEETNQVTRAAQSASCSDTSVLMTYATESDLQATIQYFRENPGSVLLVGPNWIINAPESPALQPIMGGVVEASEPQEAAEEPPDSEATSDAPAEPPEPVEYSGTGEKVLKIKKPEEGGVLMTTTIKGPRDNNVIYSLTDDLEDNYLLVNTIGSYKGTTILDGEGQETSRLRVDVSGSWKIVLEPLLSAREVTTTAKGNKDDVLIYRSDQPAILTFKGTSGDSNVTAYWYTSDDSDLIVNDIGVFTTEAPMSAGPGVLQIESDGAWSIRIDPV